MEREKFKPPLGDPPASLDHSSIPWANTEPPSPSTIYVPPPRVLRTPSSASAIDVTSSPSKSLGQLEKLNANNFAYEPHENSLGPIKQFRKDFAIFRCGCRRLDRSRLRMASENDPANVTWPSQLAAYSIYDKSCGLCELQDAKARYQARKCSEEDELRKKRKSEKCGDHVHLILCKKLSTQPHRPPSALADLITQIEVRKATNNDEYMRTFNGKAMNLTMDTLRDMESSSVQQSPVNSRLHEIMLPNYPAELAGLDESMHTQDCPELEHAERTSQGSDSVMRAGPEEKSYVPKRQKTEDTAISRSDLSKRTEAEWEYLSSREERYVMIVPLFDACKACEKETRENTTSMRPTEGTNDPEPDEGLLDITEQSREITPSVQVMEASEASEPDDRVFLEFTEQTREDSPCVQMAEGSNALEPDLQFSEQASEDNLAMPETRDTQTLQLDENFSDQVRENTPSIHVNAPGPDPHVLDQRIEIETTSCTQAVQGTSAIQHASESLEQNRETCPCMQVREDTDAPEPSLDILRRCPFSGKLELKPMNEPLAEANGQGKPFLATFKDRIHLLKLPPGVYPRKPSTETKVARQTPLPPKHFAERIDGLQLPDGAFLQKYSTKAPVRAPKLAQIPIGGPPAPTITPAYPTDSGQHHLASKPGGQQIARPEDPPCREFISWDTAKPRRVQVPLEIEHGGDSRLDAFSTQDFSPSHSKANRRQQSSREIHGGGERQYKEPPTRNIGPVNSTGVRRQLWSSETHKETGSISGVTPSQDFGPSIPAEARRRQRPSGFGIESDPGLEGPQIQDYRPSNLMGARRNPRSSDNTREGDARLKEHRTKNSGPYDLTGAPQQQLSISWQIYPQWADPLSQDITPFHPAEIRQQQHSSEAGRAFNPRLEQPPAQDFRLSYPTGASREQRSLEIGGGAKRQLDTPVSQGFLSPQPTGIRRQQPSSSTREEDEPRMTQPPRQDFRPFHPTGGNQRTLPSETSAYGRDEQRSREPPRQDFRPSHPTGGNQRKLPSETSAYRRDSPLGPPMQAFPPPESQKGPGQKKNTRDIGGRVQPQSQAKVPPSQSFNLPIFSKGPRQSGDSEDTRQQIEAESKRPPIQSCPPPRSQQGQRPPAIPADTGGRLVPVPTEPLTQSFPPPWLQKKADVREPLGATSKQGKAPPKPRPESHIPESSSNPTNNKRSWK